MRHASSVRSDRLEQVFFGSKAGRVSVLLVLESLAGSRQRVTLETAIAVGQPAALEEAGRYVARWLARAGGQPAKLLRVRSERNGELVDAPAARAALIAELGRIADQE